MTGLQMEKLVGAILLFICLLRASAIRTNIEEEKRKALGTRLCQEQYGSFYYDDVLDTCCPCSPCEERIYGLRPKRVISCVQMNVDHCEAPYFTKCHEIGHPPPVTSDPPSLTPITNATVVNSPSDVIVTLPKHEPVAEPKAPDSMFSIVLIVVGSAILICIIIFTCLCCYAQCHGDHASKLINKFPKWSRCLSSEMQMNTEQSSVSSQHSQPLVYSETSEVPNGIHPSQPPSLASQDDPHGMVNPTIVRPNSRMSSYVSSEQRSLLSPSHSLMESPDPGRHIVTSRICPQDMNTNPQGINTTISQCSNIGLIATPSSHVVIHNLNVNCRASEPDPNHLNVLNQRIRVEAPRSNQRTFHEPIEGSEIQSRAYERDLHRQSSEISSNSSGPVENDSHAATPWNDSIAHQDQLCALRNCLQSQREDQCLTNHSNASGSYGHSSAMSYPTMSSDVTSYPSQRNSSGLPPQGDMID